MGWTEGVRCCKFSFGCVMTQQGSVGIRSRAPNWKWGKVKFLFPLTMTSDKLHVFFFFFGLNLLRPRRSLRSYVRCALGQIQWHLSTSLGSSVNKLSPWAFISHLSLRSQRNLSLPSWLQHQTTLIVSIESS